MQITEGTWIYPFIANNFKLSMGILSFSNSKNNFSKYSDGVSVMLTDK
jgi:hypothetical protein